MCPPVSPSSLEGTAGDSVTHATAEGGEAVAVAAARDPISASLASDADTGEGLFTRLQVPLTE